MNGIVRRRVEGRKALLLVNDTGATVSEKFVAAVATAWATRRRRRRRSSSSRGDDGGRARHIGAL